MDHDASNRKPVAHHTCILYLQRQQSISSVMRAHARIRIRCERVQCEHMRCERMRCECAHSHHIACERISHASCAHSHTLFGRVPRPLCEHMRAFACDASHSHRMRMRTFKGNLCVSGTVVVSINVFIIKIAIMKL